MFLKKNLANLLVMKTKVLTKQIAMKLLYASKNEENKHKTSL